MNVVKANGVLYFKNIHFLIQTVIIACKLKKEYKYYLRNIYKIIGLFKKT